MFELLVFGSWLFWAAALVVSVAIFSAIENEQGYGLMIFLTAIFALLFGKPLLYIHWSTALFCVAAYLIIGGLWAVWRWFIHAKKVVHKARLGETVYERDLDVAHNKGHITAWIAYWPWSLFWEFTHGIFSSVYHAFVGIFDRISSGARNEISKLRK